MVEVKLSYAHCSFLHVSLTTARGLTWKMTVVYANPNASKRRHLWVKLDTLKIEAPWLVLGDFNCVLRDEDRSSMRGASSSFQAWVCRNRLVDLGYEGTEFTWNHGVNKETRRSARLDRALCDTSWRLLFPAASVKHLTHSHSDHCPLLVELEERKGVRFGSRPFRFEAAWILHEEFEIWFKNEWSPSPNLTATLKNLTVKL